METKFEIPDHEKHKLDHVREDLQNQPWHLQTHDLILSQPWAFLAAAALLGGLLGFFVRRR